MEIVLLEPFFAGSHASWAQEYAARSRHHIKILSLKGQHWKWRMHGGAVTLATEFLAGGYKPDLLLATDMLDLTTFLALTRKLTFNIPTAIYFHENQLTYPWSPTDPDPEQQRDIHYGFINYASALAADVVLFNSDYHQRSFLQELPGFLKAFPDYNEAETTQKIIDKSRTLHLGLDLKKFDGCRRDWEKSADRPPLILWNHRWEYDKNPQEFFQALYALQEQNIDFELAVLGESYRNVPNVFAEAKLKLSDHIVHWGYEKNFSDYAAWLLRADILPVTSIHDFFGMSVVQAIYCNCFPLLPKRLAYPEHITADYSERCFYTNFDDLVVRLKSACLNIESLRQEKLQVMVAHYDWGGMGAVYDDLLEKIK
ncbi:MAG: DUF3524 domain-containing protein [Desulfuromusa sp.]|jgi:glycosyltransferase involved in cell wall biosynthesis|nr:DUF3524 domain-containing protein [Desulfuromusa sp.]